MGRTLITDKPLNPCKQVNESHRSYRSYKQLALESLYELLFAAVKDMLSAHEANDCAGFKAKRNK